MRAIQLNTNYEPSMEIIRDDVGCILSGLQLGETLHQNQALILQLHKGELKENPAVGCGISDMLLDNDPLYWRTVIREQLELDNQIVSAVKITKTGIVIDAKYNV